MWAAMTKDLGDFANVLTRDVHRVVEGDESSATAAASQATGGVVAGDELSPEGTLFHITQEELEWLQGDVATFALPLTADEQVVLARTDLSEGRDTAALLEENETVRDQYSYLVKQSVAQPAATPKTAKRTDAFDDLATSPGPSSASPGQQEEDAAAKNSAEELDSVVSHDDFFRRYFVRLLLLRRSSSASRRKPPTSAHDVQKDVDGGDWGDVNDDDEDAKRTRSLAPDVRVAGASRTSGQDAVQSHMSDEERAKYELRIRDLEKLVKALSSQVDHLQGENARLHDELRATATAASASGAAATAAAAVVVADSSSSGASPAPKPPRDEPAPTAAASASSAAPRATSSSQMAIDDDEWATLS